MKTIKLLSFAFLILISMQSCDDWFQRNFQPKSINQHGYITDTLDNGIADVKITVYRAEDWSSNGEETDMVFYTDENGYYKIKIKDIDYVYRMKMTHEYYIYPNRQHFLYPQITSGITEEDINYQMVKKGPVKIEGYTTCDEDTNYWVNNVKISVLKRSVGSTNYPDTTGIYTFTDENAHYYIEFKGNENYEFFLKPEKDGYYFEYMGVDYIKTINTDPGYIKKQGFPLLKLK